MSIPRFSESLSTALLVEYCSSEAVEYLFAFTRTVRGVSADVTKRSSGGTQGHRNEWPLRFEAQFLDAAKIASYFRQSNEL